MLIVISKCMFVYGLALLKIFEIFYTGLTSPSFSAYVWFDFLFVSVSGFFSFFVF